MGCYCEHCGCTYESETWGAPFLCDLCRKGFAATVRLAVARSLWQDTLRALVVGAVE